MCGCCLGASCVSSWSNYSLKQGILWNFLSLFVYINLFILVHEKHKKNLVWEHVVSYQEAATALNREPMFILILYLPFHETHKNFMFGSTLYQIMEQLRPALNRESLIIFFVYFCLYWVYVFLFMKIINIFLFDTSLCQLIYQLLLYKGNLYFFVSLLFFGLTVHEKLWP